MVTYEKSLPSDPKTGLKVPKRGLEPPRAYAHYTLNVARLPIPPFGLVRFLNGTEDSAIFSLKARKK